MKRKLIIGIMILVTMPLKSKLNSQEYWKRCPLPVVAEVRDIILSQPGILVAGTSAGVYWSDDWGESWKEGNGNLPDKNIRAIADLALHRLVASTDQGVFISSDLGTTWKEAKDSHFAKQINEFEMDYHLTVYAATENGVWRSQDQGDTWQTAGLQGIDIRAVAVSVNGDMLAGASRNGDDGIYESKDFGSHWTRVDDRIQGVNALDIVPHGRFAGTYNHDPFQSNVLKFNQQDAQWHDSGLINCSVSSFAFGVYPHMFAGINRLGFWPDTSTYYGVQYSQDAGRNWITINQGLDDTDVQSLLVFWDELFAGTSTGIFKRTIHQLTAIEQPSIDEIQCNWNPSSGKLELTSSTTIPKLEWTLSDVQGKIFIKDAGRNIKQKSISCFRCTDGLYFLNLKAGKHRKTFSFYSHRR